MRTARRVPRQVVFVALVIFSAPVQAGAASLTAWLQRSDDQQVRAGRPFEIQVRATFDAPLAAVDFDLSASADAQAALAARSADPIQRNGLAFVSETSQVPFENGLPHDFGVNGPIREVLLAVTEPPFDGLYPGEGVLLERVTVVPRGGGALTISMGAGHATTTRDDPDGRLFDEFHLDAERATITVFVHVGFDDNVDGDVDLEDFHALQWCFSGEDVPAIESCTAVFDDDADGDLDLPDLTVFVAGMTGPQTLRTMAAHATITPAMPGSAAASTITPDVDGSGIVDERDLVFVRARLRTTDVQADANGDGVVNLLDLVAVRNRLEEGGTLRMTERFRITEIWPWESQTEPAWIELKYDERSGATVDSMYLFELSIRSAGSAAGFDMAPRIEPGYTILVRYDGPAPPEFLGDGPPYEGVLIHARKPLPAQPVFDPLSDECVLRYRESDMSPRVTLDRVEWGDVPELHDTLNTVVEPIPEGGSIGRDPVETATWRRYLTPTPGADNGLPPPTAYYPYSGAELVGDQVIRFVWLDYRYAATQYRLQVADDQAFTSPTVDVVVPGTRYDLTVPLPPGGYYWRVRTQYRSMEGAWSSAPSFTVLPTGIPPLVPIDQGDERTADAPAAAGDATTGAIGIDWFLTNGVEAPRQDSWMVCMECRYPSYPHPWDGPHNPGSCEHARYYAPQAVIATMNRFYGGQATQDELTHWGTVLAGGNLVALGHGDPRLAGRELELLQLLNYALGGVQAAYHPQASEVEQIIRQRHPVFTFLRLSEYRPIVIFGYENSLGPGHERAIYYDPVVGKVPLPVSITDLSDCYYQATPSGPLPDSVGVFSDNDHDGLVDLDEEYRFFTDKSNPDTDGDAVTDKIELWSYRFGQGFVPRHSNTDGDLLPPEKDPDSDDDGCLDGLEDTNLNGTLAGRGWAGLMYLEEAETDPYFAEQYVITLTMDRPPAKLCFRECSDIKLMITDPFGRQVKNATVELKVDTTMGSFGPSGGQPIDTARVVTSGVDWVRQRFCALEKQGVARVEASWTRCQDSPAPVTGMLDVNIVPYDWIFAVQEEAILTGDLITEDYDISGWSSVPPREWGQRGSRSMWKHEGVQLIKGRLEYPGATDPGKWIDSISLVFSPGANRDHSLLMIDNASVADGHTWTRTSQDQSPNKWQILFADIVGDVADWNSFPRYISVRSGGSTKERRAPLLWWRSCSSAASRARILRHETRLGPVGSTEWVWVVLAYDDEQDLRAEFFFGDGNSEGHDRGDNSWQQGEDSTSVGFIPIGAVNGLAIRHYEYALWNLSWWQQGQPTGGTAVNHDVFSWRKSECYVGPPFGWTVMVYPEDSGPTVDELRKQLAAPPAISILLDDIRFKRDYVGNDRDELIVRGLEAPVYTVRMRSTP